MPLYGKPMTTEKIISELSSPDAIEDMAYAIRDWSDAVDWLIEFGAPDETPDGIRYSLVDMIKWVVENVEHERIKES